MKVTYENAEEKARECGLIPKDVELVEHIANRAIWYQLPQYVEGLKGLAKHLYTKTDVCDRDNPRARDFLNSFADYLERDFQRWKRSL